MFAACTSPRLPACRMECRRGGRQRSASSAPPKTPMSGSRADRVSGAAPAAAAAAPPAT